MLQHVAVAHAEDELAPSEVLNRPDELDELVPHGVQALVDDSRLPRHVPDGELDVGVGKSVEIRRRQSGAMLDENAQCTKRWWWAHEAQNGKRRGTAASGELPTRRFLDLACHDAASSNVPAHDARHPPEQIPFAKFEGENSGGRAMAPSRAAAGAHRTLLLAGLLLSPAAGQQATHEDYRMYRGAFSPAECASIAALFLERPPEPDTRTIPLLPNMHDEFRVSRLSRFDDGTLMSRGHLDFIYDRLVGLQQDEPPSPLFAIAGLDLPPPLALHQTRPAPPLAPPLALPLALPTTARSADDGLRHRRPRPAPPLDLPLDLHRR